MKNMRHFLLWTFSELSLNASWSEIGTSLNQLTSSLLQYSSFEITVTGRTQWNVSINYHCHLYDLPPSPPRWKFINFWSQHENMGVYNVLIGIYIFFLFCFSHSLCVTEIYRQIFIILVKTNHAVLYILLIINNRSHCRDVLKCMAI